MLVFRQKKLNLSLRVLVSVQVRTAFQWLLNLSNFNLGYTISRAILSDAIALTRGDRYFTADYTPFNLTAWGFNDCQRTPDGAGFGSTLGRLFLRTLPGQFTSNSVYTWFPLMTPGSMKTNLTKLNLINTYDVNRPQSRGPAKIVKEYNEVTEILQNTEAFKPTYASRAAKVIRGNG
jgi:linoleate 10R-lipoxygenase